MVSGGKKKGNKSAIFNKGGDFTTSPEISQMFGEMIGIWLVSALDKYSNLKHTNIVECGPGLGTLSCDIIRTFKQLNMLQNITFYYVEISEPLREKQQDNIREAMGKYLSQDLETGDLYDDELNLKFIWKDNISKIARAEYDKKKKMIDSKKRMLFRRAVEDDNPYLIVWNELFDAIPVYQFIYDDTKGWLERVVNYSSDNKLLIQNSEKPTLNVEKLLQPEKTFASEEARNDLKTGDMIEISPHSQNLIAEMAELWSISKGCGIAIDYGEDQVC